MKQQEHMTSVFTMMTTHGTPEILFPFYKKLIQIFDKSIGLNMNKVKVYSQIL